MPADVAWPKVGAVDPGDLVDARLEAHHALQLIVSLGVSYLPHQDDDSHTNLEWLSQLRVLVTHVIAGAGGFRGALRLEDLTLMVLDNRSRPAAELPLSARTVADGYDWLRNQVQSYGVNVGQLTERKHYTIPDHPVAKGAAFKADTSCCRELAAYYGGAALVLQPRAPNTAPVRCWPHHFDIATLITLDQIGQEGARTVGVGLSPGDDSYAEPYYYVTPYPYPQASLPTLARGRWHTMGWTGAVLRGSDLIAIDSGNGQRAGVEEFLDDAVSGCRSLLAG
jgi:hypothetical protein